MALLAGVGAAETGAISYSKLLGDGNAIDALCVAGGACSDVLNGPWADVAGVPLSAFGAIAYTSVGVLAVAPTLQQNTLEAPIGSKAADAALLGLTAAMATFSACLMLLLAVEIQLQCSLCIGSALISTLMFGVAWRSRLLADRTESFVVAASSAAIALAAAAALYFSGDNGEESFQVDADGFPTPPSIRSRSSEEALELARRMRAKGGRMFGAFWCSHCINQKETLGREAMQIVPYIECDAEGSKSQRELCVDTGVRGYPTWQLDGQLFPGEKDLGGLRALLDELDKGSPIPSAADVAQ